mmetsp:Transcript_24065/g.67554  ORF Transcript_24065/g.67554 Transcript_24065/m.67554 type:complete len:214 (+) Transcript_24065:406-1047(+)
MSLVYDIHGQGRSRASGARAGRRPERPRWQRKHHVAQRRVLQHHCNAGLRRGPPRRGRRCEPADARGHVVARLRDHRTYVVRRRRAPAGKVGASDGAAARRLWCRRPVRSVLGGGKGRVGRGVHSALGAPERTPVSGVLNTRRTVPRAQGPYPRRQRRRQLARLRAPLPPPDAAEVPVPRGPRPRDEFRRAPRRARAPPTPTLPRRARVRALV